MTSLVDLILRCPECGGFNRLGAVASTSAFLVRRWSDGHAVPSSKTAEFIRCASCRRLHPSHAFESLGPINYGRHVGEIRLVALGDSPLRVMMRLRAIYGWSLAEAKSLVAMLPMMLPKLRAFEDTEQLQRALVEDGAVCELREVAVEEPDPSERMNAPAALIPLDPFELTGVVRKGMPREFAARLYAYHLSNDRYRDPGREWVGLMERTPFEVENILALQDLLDGQDEVNRLVRANIARESGDFESASLLLRNLKPVEHSIWHGCLSRLVANRIGRVSLLEFNP